MRQTEPSAILIALPIIFVLMIITVVIVAALFLTDILTVGQNAGRQTPAPKPNPSPVLANDVAATPAPLGLTTWHSTALGFALDYPVGWRKRENTLEVTLSPSAAGLDPIKLQDSAVWLGIPAGNTLNHGEILRGVLVNFAKIEILNQDKMTLAGATWTTVKFSFEGQKTGEKGWGLAAAANKNEVGYFMVLTAPTGQWEAMQPTLQSILNSFRFTEEAVLRPTDATPPPTPTPTPTPMIYVVQSGDTLMGIALQFGVEMDTLAARNGIEKPELLQTGQELIIPLKH
jgi:LysM repeat protein